MTKNAVTKSQLGDVSKLIKCLDRSVAGEWSYIHYGTVGEMGALRDALSELLNNANQHIASLTQPAASSSINELREQVRDLTHEVIMLRGERENMVAKYSALDVRYDNALQGVEKAERTILALAEVLAGKQGASKVDGQEKKVVIPFTDSLGQSSVNYVGYLDSMLKEQGFTIYRGTIENHSKDPF